MSPSLRSRSRAPEAPALGGGSRHRPVVLATLAVPFEAEAARIAIQAAMEGSVKLIVVDAVEMPLWPQSMAMRYAELEEDSDREAIRRLVEQTAALGIDVEHLRVRSPRPVEALLEVAGERDAGPAGDRAGSGPAAPAHFPQGRQAHPQAVLVPVVGGGRGPVGPRPLRGQSPTAAALGCGVPISS